MKRKGAEGLSVDDRLTPAANEEFTSSLTGLDTLQYPRAGWDPYEVWRSRVKNASGTKREPDPLS
jgi:hypothetical protein